MNEYDSNRILDLTKKIDYVQTVELQETDCFILNTCHIREKATDKVYHEIGRVKKKFRNKIVNIIKNKLFTLKLCNIGLFIILPVTTIHLF